MTRALAALCAALLLAGCATTRNFEQPSTEFLRTELKPGDRLTVVATTGAVYRLRLTRVGDDALFGQGARKQYQIAFSMIESVEVHREHPVAATSGVVGGALTIAFVAAVIAAFENMEDQNWDFCGGN